MKSNQTVFRIENDYWSQDFILKDRFLLVKQSWLRFQASGYDLQTFSLSIFSFLILIVISK